MARRAAPRSRHSLPPPATQRLRRRPRAAAMADVEDGEEPCALSSHSGSAGSKSGGDKMFSLKKWNAVAMWSWDVECDTCAICRVQVMGKRCTRGPGRVAASAGPAPGVGDRPSLGETVPGGVGAGSPCPGAQGPRATPELSPVRGLRPPPGAVGSFSRRPALGTGILGREMGGKQCR